MMYWATDRYIADKHFDLKLIPAAGIKNDIKKTGMDDIIRLSFFRLFYSR